MRDRSRAPAFAPSDCGFEALYHGKALMDRADTLDPMTIDIGAPRQ